MTTKSVYLCHKCRGTLTAHNIPNAYRCSCISGYVRDWQTPTPVENVECLQVQALQERLKLYMGQKRNRNDPVVRYARERLEAWDTTL